MIPVLWLWLTRKLGALAPVSVPSPGPGDLAEARVLAVFALTALARITRSEPFGGWSGLLAMPGASDAGVAFIAIVALFLIPDGAGGKLELEGGGANSLGNAAPVRRWYHHRPRL